MLPATTHAVPLYEYDCVQTFPSLFTRSHSGCVLSPAMVESIFTRIESCKNPLWNAAA